MRVRFAILSIVAFAVGTATMAYSVRAENAPVAVPDLQVVLLTARSEAWVGETVIWQVWLKNDCGTLAQDVQLEPASEVWMWPDGAARVGRLADSGQTVVQVETVPKVPGELWPILQVRFTCAGVSQSIMATAARPVKVRNVGEAVEARLVLAEAEARAGRPIPLEMWIKNDSPFTLVDIALAGLGADVDWAEMPPVDDLASDETSMALLSAVVRGHSPQLALSLAYSWTDSIGRRHADRMLVESPAREVETTTTEQMPWAAVTAFVGFAFGVASWWIQTCQERAQKRQVNRDRVLGMLQLMQVECQWGADEGSDISLDLFKELFSQEGLYAALRELDQKAGGLKQCVSELWQAAGRHNAGLGRPDGADRTARLRELAQQLHHLLQRVRCGRGPSPGARTSLPPN
jgi:hypothetical protein